MYANVKESPHAKGLLWACASATVLLLVFALLALNSGAGASPLLRPEAGAPPPAPTVPGTLPPSSPTILPGQSVTPGTPVVGTPTVPGPVPTNVPTPGACSTTFSDVEVGAWYYDYIMWMACNGIVNGYSDGTFRPGNPATRGQIVKIVVGAFALPLHADAPYFADVPAGSTFFDWIQTATFYGIVVGYPCGGPGEPCNAQSQPYYRPNSDVTRAQLTKIIVLAAQQWDPVGWALLNPPQPTFNDVPAGSTFYGYVETALAHSVLEGYACGGPGEPCPGRYFRPNGNATRAQLSKMVYEAVLP
ncbi:MAG: S-layer homology domain-containing protein [Chloroflexia bacterium]